MSNVSFFAYPQITRELNQLQKEVLPAGVHPAHLMRLCKSVEVSSISELKDGIWRAQGPRVSTYTYTASFLNPFWSNPIGGTPKPSLEVPPNAGWQSQYAGTDHNVFRIALIFRNPPTSEQFFTQEVLLEEEDEILIYKNRMQYITDVIESQLVMSLLIDRGISLANFPFSYIGCFAQTLMGLQMLEPGAENFYFMLPNHQLANFIRQVPPRTGAGLHIFATNPSSKMHFVPVPQMANTFPFWLRLNMVGYSDYLVKTTTRYYMDLFRVDRINRSSDDRNYYKLIYERYVSYVLPVGMRRQGSTLGHTWAIVTSLNNALNPSTIDEISAIGNDFTQIFNSNINTF